MRGPLGSRDKEVDVAVIVEVSSRHTTAHSGRHLVRLEPTQDTDVDKASRHIASGHARH